MKATITLFIVHCMFFFGMSQDDASASSQVGFIQNSGQIKDQSGHTNADLLYLLPGTTGLNTQLRSTGFSYDLYSNVNKGRGTQTTFNRIDIEFVDFNPLMTIEASGKQKQYSNYYRGGVENGVNTNIAQFGEVVYKNVYANIDIIFKIDPASGGLKYDIVLHPDADASDLKFKYTGFNSLNQSADNALEIQTNIRTLTESIPLSYYREDQKEVDISFALLSSEGNSKTIGFITPKTIGSSKNTCY